MISLLSGKMRPASGPTHPVHPGWMEYTPVVRLVQVQRRVRLRPLQYNDGAAWRMQRLVDQHILEPVEPTVETTWQDAHSSRAWRAQFLGLRAMAQEGVVLPMAIEVDGAFAGQLTLGGIHRGVAQECWIGYWVHSSFTGMGVASAACALGVDHAFGRVGLHRVTATYLPENIASKRVLHHAGFREEGFLRGNLHIGGRWRDHVLVAQTSDEYVHSCVERLVLSARLEQSAGPEQLG